QESFAYVGLDWQDYVEIDPRYFRPTEVDHLAADITKARRQLQWSPRITFYDLVKIMVDADMRSVGLEPPGEGDKILRKHGFHWIGGDSQPILKEPIPSTL
ncbi:MAG TPA: GDP-mannose 4,6-dehydratase, partial [Dehalococcoidia bacterium]|nr:GDP-mannose 4,6-dehydratase [Dehalococcoidia bacterium]